MRISSSRRVRVLLQQPVGARDHARRAVAALQAVMLAERLLQRVQRAAGCAMPSMVSMSAPSACTANTVQDFTDLPSRSTVQAPQCVVSQPICGPVCASSRAGSGSAACAARPAPRPACRSPSAKSGSWPCANLRSGGADLARASARDEHHAGHLGAVVGVPRRSEAGDGDRLGGGDGALHASPRRAPSRRGSLAASSAKSGVSATLVRPIAQDADLAAFHRAARRPRRRWRSRRSCASASRRPSRACRRRRDADRGQDLAGLQRGHVGALIEDARRDPAARRPCRRAR